MKRSVFVDCGSNTCRILEKRIAAGLERDFFAFEAQPELAKCVEPLRAKYPDVSIEFENKAVWVEDGTLELFLATKWGPNHRGGSTVMQGHVKNAAEVDYATPIPIRCFDFSKWLGERFTSGDRIVVKMDIEGAEYPVLEKLIADNTIDLVDTLYVEFHWNMSEIISRERHDRLVSALAGRTSLQPWE